MSRPDTEQFAFDTGSYVAWIPFATMPLRVALYIGLPVALGWWLMQIFGPLGATNALLIPALLALAGLRQALRDGRRIGKHFRKLCTELVEVDAEGIRLPTIGDEREKLGWWAIEELVVTRAGGLLQPPAMRLGLGRTSVPIPRCVEDHGELLHLIRKRAELREARHGWWATVYREA
ncbi:MAG: hypothetical protein U9R79_08490 [Armatimonadota bacterium]|nr:hypothetical protein [Armatimonadota bacterium]